MRIGKIIGYGFILFSLLFLNGCIVAALGAGVGAMTYAASKKAAANKGAYNQYLLGMQELNFKRQKAGLKAEPILSPKEYNQASK